MTIAKNSSVKILTQAAINDEMLKNVKRHVNHFCRQQWQKELSLNCSSTGFSRIKESGYFVQIVILSWICRTCVSLYLATLIDKTLRRTVLLYSVLPCRRLSSDCRHVRHKLTIMPRSGAVLTLTIDYVIRSNLFNHLHMTGVRASPPLSSTGGDFVHVRTCSHV